MSTSTTDEADVPEVPMPEGGEVVEPPEPPPADEVLPDMTSTLIADMREGVLRYRALAEVEDGEAEKHETAGPQCRMEARDYRAKAKTLAGMLNTLGYDADDRTVSPERPEGIHA
jgi:hypothetical protein